MAEFKLGRIKFVWKDAWVTGTTYYIDDVVKYGGSTYICSVGHVAAADFNTDLVASTPRWNVMSTGQAFKGDWATSTLYKLNDVVKYGGNLYICVDSHTSASTAASGLETNSADWNTFAEGVSWTGDWATSIRYKKNEIVKYGGISYICNTGHTSAATEALGLEADQGSWSTFNSGLEYKGDWADTTKYIVNDIVKYGAGLWICVTNHTSTSSFNSGFFQQFLEGLQYENAWSNATSYQPGDIVSYGGNQYVALVTTINEIPPTNPSSWDLFSQGFSFQSDWSIGTYYKIGEVVRLNGYTYVATSNNVGSEPPSASWSRLNSGIYWRGQWLNSTAYKAGDAVRFNTNTYVCVLAHTSDDDDSSLTPTVNSPEKDVTGTFWNVLTLGTETSVLSTTGDMIYYGGAGPTRLPVGTQGQVLKVNAAGEPVWDHHHYVEDVYYVAPHGVDVPAPVAGLTLDAPWKTIRYATEQIDKGPKYPNARRLLELNRAFIQREVTEWVDYQISTNTGPFTSSFDYDEYKCERDTGFIVDALLYDLGHGGNVKSRGAANAYVGALIDSPGIYTKLGVEKEEDVAAFTYMLELVENILNNEAPAVNYQVLNGDNSTAVVAQFIDADIEAESGVITEIADLVGIITDAITAGVATNIPARDINSTLLHVKTGSYLETLPIIVPAECCVIGDEVRSVTVGPSTSLVNISDAKYSIGAMSRLEEIVGDIITGGSITPTTGNTATRSQSVPFADTLEVTAIEQLVSTIKHKIDFSLSTNALISNADPTGYNISYLIGYGDARKLIKENRAFFQEELKAYLDTNYPDLKYSRTTCLRDVGLVVDALVYDLTYGGNAQTVVAALAYYEGVGSSLVIDSTEKTATLAAYAYLKTLVQAASLNTAIAATQTIVPQFRDTAGSAGASTFLGANMDELIDIIDNGVASATLTDPSTTWVSGALTAAYSSLDSAVSTIQSNAISYINTTYPSLVGNYNETKCSRDIGIILKAVGYDFMFNSNFQTTKAAHSYLRSTASEVFSLGQKTATRGALEYVRTQAIASVGGDTTAIARINSLMKLVDTVIFSGSNEGSVCATEERNRDHAVLQLERNREFITAEVDAYIADTYTDTATNTTASTNVITISDTSWLQRNTAIRFTGTTIGGISTDTTYYVQNVVSSTTFTVALTRNSTSALTLTTATGSMTVSLYYNSELCLRDVNEYIDALKFDIKYPGNYKSLLAARYYINAVTGSLEEDMYYLRNGTGIRNQTMSGLTGDLTPENSYGTSRVTAGAYVSLDPGWGPDDYRTWITSRSPYVQNNATFGYAAIGQKIDGSLHAGGNASIVSNDFTQLISDGIGAWVTNNGRAELVSVFTYYSHIGYLAENGGKIRATNGNNSYGDFGSVAEGVDATEVPGTAVVDNRSQFEAEADVFTDGTSILSVEYQNAGNDYSQATMAFSGNTGLDATVVVDDFRDDAVFQVRLLQTALTGDGQFGGDGYMSKANTAQVGTTTQITIAATDGEVSTAYIGMKIVLDGGTAVGQYGIIDTYNSGSKIATVVRESDGAAGWDHMVPGTEIVAPDASTTYIIEPAISFTAPAYSTSAVTLPTATWTDIIYASTSNTFSAQIPTGGTGTGATFNVIQNGTAYTTTLATAGLGYSRLDTLTIAGTALGGTSTGNDVTITITAVNSTNGAIQAFESTGYHRGGRFVAISTTTAGGYSNDGTTWSSVTMPTAGAGTWKALATGKLDDGSTTAEPVSLVVAIANGSNAAAYSTNGTTFSASTLPSSATWVDVVFGGTKFVAIAADNSTAYSGDGVVWVAGNSLPSTGYTSIAYGKGIYVAVKGGSATTEAAYSTDGITWTTKTIPSADWVSVAYGNGRFVAVSTGSDVAAYSLDGQTWTASTLPASTTWTHVGYGQGVFFAVASGGTQAASSEFGMLWTTRSLTTSATWTASAFGNPNKSGLWIAVDGASSTTVGRKVLTGAKAKGRCSVATEKIFEIRISDPGSGYLSAPTMTITDPNNIYEAPFTVRIGKGALSQPAFISRGSGFSAASVLVYGNGYADYFQNGQFIAVKRLSKRPLPGSNVIFEDDPDTVYKLVNVTSFLGSFDGAYTAFLQISPQMSVSDAPDHEDDVTTRIQYSQCRLTGHDFLSIGTGNFTNTNYPGLPLTDPIQANETIESGGGRVFYTSTDQDGNFRVGALFTIEQSTGVATLNADAFNIAGLQELTLGTVSLGGNSAAINEFSTDPFFTADSDNIVPTQRAIKAYIAAQIGGGGASINVNSVTAGSIFISSNVITTTTGGQINVRANVEFNGGVTGLPVAFNYFLL